VRLLLLPLGLPEPEAVGFAEPETPLGVELPALVGTLLAPGWEA